MTSLFALCCLLLCAEGQPRFRASVEGVRIDVLVTDAQGRPVPGLEAADFDLRDSGIPQHIETLTLEEESLRVLLVLDVSSSVAGEPLSHLRRAAQSVLDLLRPLDRAAILTFDEDVTLAAGWTGDTAVLRKTLDTVNAHGATAVYDAAFAALTLRDTLPGRSLIILFSDGADTSSWLAGGDVVDMARRTDAVVYTVTVRHPDRQSVAGFRVDVSSGVQHGVPQGPIDSLKEPFLPALAAETGGAFLGAESVSRLRDTFITVVREFRTRYLLTYVPRDVPQNGWHPIQVTLKNRKGLVAARRGYLR